MAEPIDVYHQWLGIAETARPLNHYQLLRLKLFEDRTARIRAHYRKMNAHVRKFATGDYAKESQDLLNELAAAMLCLSDAQRKREYDATLGRKDQREGRRQTLEEILLAGKMIDQDQLNKARGYAEAVGLEVRDALVQQKMLPAEAVMLAYAESQGLPYIELEDIGVDEELVPQIPPTLARQHSCLPVLGDGKELLMASPKALLPDIEEELRLRFNMPVRTVLCTATSINAFITKYYPRNATTAAAAPAPKPSPAATAKSKPPGEPLAPEEKTARRGKLAFLTFNLAVMLYVLSIVFFRGASTLGFTDSLIAFGFGAIAAGIAFAVMVVFGIWGVFGVRP